MHLQAKLRVRFLYTLKIMSLRFSAVWLALSLCVIHARTQDKWERPDTLLITVDTLRADYLGSYGNTDNGHPGERRGAFHRAYC